MEPDAPVEKSEMKSEDALYDDAYAFVIEKQKQVRRFTKTIQNWI